jgi:hypothetical protein
MECEVTVLETLAKLKALAIAVVAMAVVAVAGSFIAVRPDGTVDPRVGQVVLFLLGSLLVGWIALFLAHKVCFYRRIEMYESRHTPDARTQPPKAVADQVAVLIGLGFEPIGEYEFRWPWQGWQKAWMFGRSDIGVAARVGPGLTMCFSSSWADGSELFTIKGMARRVFDLEGARVVVANGSVPVVLEAHAALSAEIGQTRGASVPVGSVAEALANDIHDVAVAKRLMRASWVSPHTWALLALLLGLMLAPAVIILLLP